MINLPFPRASRSATSLESCAITGAYSSRFPKSPLMESSFSSPRTFTWNPSSACGKPWAPSMKSGDSNSSSWRLQTRRKHRSHLKPTGLLVATGAGRCYCALRGARCPRELILTITMGGRCCVSACHSNTPSPVSSKRGSSSSGRHTASARTTFSPSTRCAMQLSAWGASCAAKTTMV